MGLIDIVKGTALSMGVKYVRNHKEYGPVFTKVVTLLRGKSIYTGALLEALPRVAVDIRTALIHNGLAPMTAVKYTAWGDEQGVAVAAIVHKIALWADEQSVE